MDWNEWAIARPRLGTLLTIDHPVVMEVARLAGFDWLWVDAEHGGFTPSSAALCCAINQGGPPVFVRIPDHSPTAIKQYLDSGCDGIILPQVSTIEEVDAITRAALYPPRGQRSIGLARAQAYGARFTESIREESYAIFVQIETVEGVQNASAIAQHEGIDGVIVGPYDLSGSFGIPGQVEAPQVIEGIASVLEATHTAGKPCGIFAANADKARAYAQAGFNLIGVGIDSNTLLNAYTAMRQAIAD